MRFQEQVVEVFGHCDQVFIVRVEGACSDQSRVNSTVELVRVLVGAGHTSVRFRALTLARVGFTIVFSLG